MLENMHIICKHYTDHVPNNLTNMCRKREYHMQQIRKSYATHMQIICKEASGRAQAPKSALGPGPGPIPAPIWGPGPGPGARVWCPLCNYVSHYICILYVYM